MGERRGGSECSQTQSTRAGVKEFDELKNVLGQEIEARNRERISSGAFSAPMNDYLETQKAFSTQHFPQIASGDENATSEANARPSISPSTQQLDSDKDDENAWWKSLDFDGPLHGCGEPSTPRRRLTPLSPRQCQEASLMVTSPVVNAGYLAGNSRHVIQERVATPASSSRVSSDSETMRPRAVLDLFSRRRKRMTEDIAETEDTSDDAPRTESHDEVVRLMAMKPHQIHFVADAISRCFLMNDLIIEPWKLVIGYVDTREDEVREHLLICWLDDATEQVALAPEHIKYIMTPSDTCQLVLWENKGESPGFGVFLPNGPLSYPLAQ